MTALNARKFKELLLYLAKESADDPGFGAVKLNKLLFFSDFEAFRQLGEAITGARYQKLPWGPAAIEFIPLRDELLREERVRVDSRQRGNYDQHVTVPLAEPNLGVFSERELALVQEVLLLLQDRDATDVSEISHRVSAGWNLVEEGEVIPYETVFISMKKPSDALYEHAKQVARDRGWVKHHP